MQQTKTQNKTRWFLLVATLMAALFRIMPIFQGYLRSYGEMAVLAIVILALFPIRKKTLESVCGTLIIAVAFLLLQNLTRDDTSISNVITIIRNAYIMVLAVYLCDSETEAKDVLKTLFWVSLIAISITQITTIIGIGQYPLVARLAINGDAEAVAKEYEGLQAARLNIGGYWLAYTAPVVTSLLFGIWKRKETKWYVFVANVILTMWFLIAVQFTMALLIYAVTLISLFLSNGSLKKMFVIALVAIILSLSFSNLVSDIFSDLSQTTESPILSERFEDISDFAAGEDADDSTADTRLKKYKTSIETFSSHPFFGMLLSDGKRGGHSAILDYLATSGLFGFGFLISAFRSVYKKTIYKYRKTPFFSCVILGQIMFFICAIINPVFGETPFWILFIMSAGACEIMKEKDKENNDSVALQHPDFENGDEHTNQNLQTGKVNYRTLY